MNTEIESQPDGASNDTKINRLRCAQRYLFQASTSDNGLCQRVPNAITGKMPIIPPTQAYRTNSSCNVYNLYGQYHDGGQDARNESPLLRCRRANTSDTCLTRSAVARFNNKRSI